MTDEEIKKKVLEKFRTYKLPEPISKTQKNREYFINSNESRIGMLIDLAIQEARKESEKELRKKSTDYMDYDEWKELLKKEGIPANVGIYTEEIKEETAKEIFEKIVELKNDILNEVLPQFDNGQEIKPHIEDSFKIFEEELKKGSEK